MRTRRLVSSSVVGVVLVATLLVGGVARAQETCVPDDGSPTRVCIGEANGRIIWEVHVDNQSLASGSFIFTSPESFEFGAHVYNKEINVSAQRYTDPETGEVKLLVCVGIGTVIDPQPEPIVVCNIRDIPA